jgi:hypothetical protein
MIRHRNELRVGYDVDGTLIIEDPKGSLSLPYGGKIKSFRVISEHVELLKHHHSRGYDVQVWSRNGEDWAHKVVCALKLQDFVYETGGKMLTHVDDSTSIEAVVGPRIFIAKEG